ncbi:hypothetical protein Ancab_040067 [Ancistrocladus abbreviatus]
MHHVPSRKTKQTFFFASSLNLYQKSQYGYKNDSQVQNQLQGRCGDSHFMPTSIPQYEKIIQKEPRLTHLFRSAKYLHLNSAEFGTDRPWKAKTGWNVTMYLPNVGLLLSCLECVQEC